MRYRYSIPQNQRKRVLVWAGWVASGLMVSTVLCILGFIVRTELAHDEQKCPFVNVELRTVDEDVAVREQRRTCLPEVEERRWLILRAGQSAREFARRRMHVRFFSPDSYRWNLRRDDQGQLVLDVRNAGARPIEVLEARLLDPSGQTSEAP